MALARSRLTFSSTMLVHASRQVRRMIDSDEMVASAATLIAFGYFAGGYLNRPAHQNQIMIGLALLLFAIVPNNASDPSPGWMRHLQTTAGPDAIRGVT